MTNETEDVRVDIPMPTETDLEGLAARAWREFDQHRTGVIRGVSDQFYGDDPRINVFDVKVDAGEAPYLTIGLFLGDHKWVMQKFTPEQALGIVGLLLSKPSVVAALSSENKHD